MLIDSKFVAEQIKHWLATPANGYLGSGYGESLKDQLHKPMMEFGADAIIRKMRTDIPVLSMVSQDNLNIYWIDQAFDEKNLVIDVQGVQIYV